VENLAHIYKIQVLWDFTPPSDFLEVLLANGKEGQRVLSCMLGVVVQIYMCVKSVFAGLAFGALRRLQTGNI